MALAVGDKLPETTFYALGENGVEKKTTSEIFGGRKVVFVGVPGAFTPTCHRSHLPGFVENRDAILEKGIDRIVVTAVNDPFVMKAWANASGATGDIMFLSDGNAEFARAAGLDTDRSSGGMGTRLKRFAMIVDDGTVEVLNIDDVPGKLTETVAARILELL
jgi:peroxiredoxin